MSAIVDVYCDFDGTVTMGDTIDVLLERLANPCWKAIEARWVSGEIGSRECMALQVPLIAGGWAAVREVLDDVKVDPTFARFASWCRKNGVALRIVSDGMDRVIHYILKREGIQVDGVFANHLVEDADGTLRLVFPYAPSMASCGAGVCKCRILEQGPRSLKAVIGDGRSDFCWSLDADLLFAKSKLLDYCRQQGKPCIPYGDFDAISRVLAQVLDSAPVSAAQLQPFFA